MEGAWPRGCATCPGRRFIFEGYDPGAHSDPGETIGTAAEAGSGLPDLPPTVTVVADPLEDDVIPEQTAANRGGPDDPTVDVVKHDDADHPRGEASATRDGKKEAGHE